MPAPMMMHVPPGYTPQQAAAAQQAQANYRAMQAQQQTVRPAGGAASPRGFCSPHESPCGGFMSVPVLVHGEDGQLYINPDFDYIKRFYLSADPQGVVIPAGGETTIAITVPAEENHLGDLLISELRAQFTLAGGGTVRNVFTELLSLQNDRLFQNAPIVNDLMWGDGFLNCCMPCCTLLQATNTMSVRIVNQEAVAVTVENLMVVGKRFLPYHYPELRSRYLAYWNQIPCTPYWLTLDNQEVTVGAGATVTALMTVPGGGDFEAMWPRASVIFAGAGNADTDIDIEVAEGVGRLWQNVPQPLGLQATLSRAVAGFPNSGFYAAAQACPCPQSTQLYKRNSRVRVTFTNNAASAATIRYTIVGCMHYVSECAPGRSLDRVRSLVPTVGPFLVGSERCPPYEQMEPVPGYGMQPLPGLPPARPLPPAIPSPGTAPPPGMQVPQGYPGGFPTPFHYVHPSGQRIPLNMPLNGMGGQQDWRRL